MWFLVRSVLELMVEMVLLVPALWLLSVPEDPFSSALVSVVDSVGQLVYGGWDKCCRIREECLAVQPIEIPAWFSIV